MSAFGKIGVFTTLLAVTTGCAIDGELVSNAGYSINTADRTVESFKSLRENNIFMQQHDYSCGAASLATLMKFYFADDVTEQSLLDEARAIFSEEEFDVIADRGLSFIELDVLSKARGYQSASVRLTSDALQKLQGPVLVYVETVEYKHFAVLRGLVGDDIYLADPSRGNIRLHLSEFMKEWGGETFVLGKKGFGIPLEHNLAILEPEEPLDTLHLARLQSSKLAATHRQLLGNSIGL